MKVKRGLVVDYIGIKSKLNEALNMYTSHDKEYLKISKSPFDSLRINWIY